MSQATETSAAMVDAAQVAAQSRGYWKTVWLRLRGDKVTIACFVVLALIVLSAATRGAIGRTLGPTLEALDGAARAARVRYSIDVDPQDTL